MAIRFRKSFKLAPGIRWNVSSSGSSWTVGPRGASVGIGKRGVHLNSGIPGTGFSSRTQLVAGGTPRSRPTPNTSTTVSLSCSIREDGTLAFVDKATGQPVSEQVVEAAKKQNREALMGLIQRKCDEINDQVEALGRLHHDTPPPTPPRFVPESFELPRPAEPERAPSGLFARLVPGRRDRLETEYQQALSRHQFAVRDWESQKAAFESAVRERQKLIETSIYSDIPAMERFFEESLSEVVWPRETAVAFEIGDQGKTVAIDVDLPEIEEMPTRFAAVPVRGLKLSVKELSKTKLQTLYAEHVQGIVFRVAGEAFAALPAAQVVTVSGYSQRRDQATGQLRDEYLISVRIPRNKWVGIDFNHLASVDVGEALARFDLRRSLSKSAVFKAIEPHEAAST